MTPLVLGIDTSCYTTSLALVHGDELLGDVRKMLPVAQGARGLRQSEGFYHHHRNLPVLFEQLAEIAPNLREISAVAYSAAPRPVEGSYMPVFTAGEDFAKTLSTAYGVPLIPLTHQEGHLRAAAWASGHDESKPFLAVHLSGGTSEILRVSLHRDRYEIDILGGTKDISAGMLLDRSGVLMGLPFPAGKYLDEAAVACSCPDPVYPISVKEGWFNLSGLENVVQRQLDGGTPQEEIAVGLLSAVSRSVGKALMTAMEATGLRRVLFSGGVSASRYLSHYLSHHHQYKKMNAVFCPGKYSVDNAVGVALIGTRLRRHMI